MIRSPHIMFERLQNRAGLQSIALSNQPESLIVYGRLGTFDVSEHLYRAYYRDMG